MAQHLAVNFEEHLHALGALVVNFNSVEHALQRIAWILINPRDDRPGQIVINAVGIARVEDLVEALLPVFVLDEAVCKRVNVAIAECRRVRMLRNDYVHAMWRVPNEAVDLSGVEAVKPPTRKSADYRVVDASASPDAMKQVSRAAFHLSEDLEQLYADLVPVLRTNQ